MNWTATMKSIPLFERESDLTAEEIERHNNQPAARRFEGIVVSYSTHFVTLDLNLKFNECKQCACARLDSSADLLWIWLLIPTKQLDLASIQFGMSFQLNQNHIIHTCSLALFYLIVFILYRRSFFDGICLIVHLFSR